jgi:hypothetical protein
VVLEERWPDEWDVGEPGDLELEPFGEFFLCVLDAGERRETGTEQAEGKPRGVLVGVEPDHQPAERRRQHRTRDHASSERQPVAAGVHRSRITRDRSHQHHPLGTEVDDAGALVDQQAEASDRQHGAGVERGGEEKGEGVHLSCCALPNVRPIAL